MESLCREPPAIPLVFAKQITAWTDNDISQFDAAPFHAANFKVSYRTDVLLIDRTHPLKQGATDVQSKQNNQIDFVCESAGHAGCRRDSLRPSDIVVQAGHAAGPACLARGRENC